MNNKEKAKLILVAVKERQLAAARDVFQANGIFQADLDAQSRANEDPVFGPCGPGLEEQIKRSSKTLKQYQQTQKEWDDTYQFALDTFLGMI
ncbi:MAG: hypothetical protein JRD89_02125 [Deltaproteobacteria bacterium]|nr:hypothetical protein [Deltaproteobacteria bacterium]